MAGSLPVLCQNVELPNLPARTPQSNELHLLRRVWERRPVDSNNWRKNDKSSIKPYPSKAGISKTCPLCAFPPYSLLFSKKSKSPLHLHHHGANPPPGWQNSPDAVEAAIHTPLPPGLTCLDRSEEQQKQKNQTKKSGLNNWCKTIPLGSCANVIPH